MQHTNEIVWSFVTAGARIHLYTYLENLQDSAIYTDTDTVIDIQKDDEPPLIECGDNLVSVTKKLQPGEFIVEFVSRGPKNYAYRFVNRTDTSKAPKTLCKIRGIPLNYSASNW